MAAIKRRRYSTPFYILLLLGTLATVSAGAQAERLPIKTYTTAEGLAHNRVERIVLDSRGFLWFCTPEGLSRFDGHSFVNYGVDQGLPFPSVNDLIEAANGEYWVATNGGGVARFQPGGDRKTSAGQNQARFKIYPIGDGAAANRVNKLYQDRAGRVWAGTDGGLFLLEEAGGAAAFHPVKLGLVSHPDQLVQVLAMLEDQEGSLWVGTKFGLLRHSPDGRVVQYVIQPFATSDHVWALLLDREGRLWLGHNSGLIIFKPSQLRSGDFPPQDDKFATTATLPLKPRPAASNTPASATDPSPPRTVSLPNAAGEARRYTQANGLAGNRVTALFQSSSGVVWIGMPSGGLTEFRDGRFRSYTEAQGLSDTLIQTLAEDRGRNLWMGTAGGAMRLARNGFVTYGQSDGLGQVAGLVFKNQDGELFVISSEFLISRIDDKRVTTVRLNLPTHITAWRANQRILLDRTGEWWVATREGVYRFPRVSRIEQLASVRPKAVYTVKDGLADNDVTRMFEDKGGDIWIAHFAPGREVLTRWDRATGKFHRFSESNGLRPFSAPIDFCEDASGNLWVGFRGGELARYAAGRFLVLTPAEGQSSRGIMDLYLDRVGRLWAACYPGGLIRIDDPGADRPRLITRTSADGLASNNLFCVTEDNLGYIYVGSNRGIDRLNPATGRIKHYAADDGVINTEFNSAFVDQHGALWFSTAKGLLRFTPESEPPTPPPPVWIGGLRIAGIKQPISELGETAVAHRELGPNQNQVEINFFGLGFDAGGPLRYQFRLEGAEGYWSFPTDQRIVNYANLAPGRYRFLVQAISSEGIASQTPATVDFTIMRPIWQRWWFLGLVALLTAAATYTIYRYRLARLIELERVRTRIATDLHDDIGSSLSQVSVLSEIISRRVGPESHVSGQLSTITRLSCDLVDSMNDIVWAINPQRDHLSDLTHRMRRFASDAFTASDVEFSFRAPDGRRDIKMGADIRREVFLIFKESVTNIVRHSGCSKADIEFLIEDGWLELRLSDDGSGFDPARAHDGNGLISMRQRAIRIGGTLTVTSSQGQGTTVRLKAPPNGRGRRRDL